MKKKLKEKINNAIKWLKEECKDRKTFIVFMCVVIIMYFPVWGGYLLYYIFRWKWFLAMASITFAFWMGPFTPFFPLCIGITLFIKGIMRKPLSKEDKYEEEQNNIDSTNISSDCNKRNNIYIDK